GAGDDPDEWIDPHQAHRGENEAGDPDPQPLGADASLAGLRLCGEAAESGPGHAHWPLPGFESRRIALTFRTAHPWRRTRKNTATPKNTPAADAYPMRGMLWASDEPNAVR